VSVVSFAGGGGGARGARAPRAPPAPARPPPAPPPPPPPPPRRGGGGGGGGGCGAAAFVAPLRTSVNIYGMLQFLHWRMQVLFLCGGHQVWGILKMVFTAYHGSAAPTAPWRGTIAVFGEQMIWTFRFA
jgi:hypothetical protein